MPISDVDVISCERLQTLLTNPSDRLRLIQVTDAAAYQQAHLPDAMLIEPSELIAGTRPAVGKLPSLARLEALFGKLGYQSQDEFVVYDDEGGGWAGRFAWTLDVIGHRRWHYLDGGLQAWVESGGPLETGPPVYPATTTPELHIDPTPIAELEDVLAAIDDPNRLIWDARSREEFLGLRSTAARAGHIPGAQHLDWMLLKDAQREMRLTENLEELLAEHGIDRKCGIITHCHTHHRSGLSYMIGRLLGFQDIRAYHGSWSEWGNRDDTPISTSATDAP